VFLMSEVPLYMHPAPGQLLCPRSPAPIHLQASGFGFRVSGSGSRVSYFTFPVSGFGFRVSGFGFHVRVSGRGTRDEGCLDEGRHAHAGGQKHEPLEERGHQGLLLCQVHVPRLPQAERVSGCEPRASREGCRVNPREIALA